jgi:DNA-binding NtrC family response regulator
MPHAIVLIVADEFLIRIHAPEMIKDAGYEVVDAINADQAIAILEARRGIRVVFTSHTRIDGWTEAGRGKNGDW